MRIGERQRAGNAPVAIVASKESVICNARGASEERGRGARGVGVRGVGRCRAHGFVRGVFAMGFLMSSVRNGGGGCLVVPMDFPLPRWAAVSLLLKPKKSLD